MKECVSPLFCYSGALSSRPHLHYVQVSLITNINPKGYAEASTQPGTLGRAKRDRRVRFTLGSRKQSKSKI